MFKYLTTDAPKAFVSRHQQAPVFLNADKLRFNLIAHPTTLELRDAVNDYATIRMAEHWDWLMETSTASNLRKKASRIRLLQSCGSTLLNANPSVVYKALGVTTAGALRRATANMPVEEQRTLAHSLQPSTIAHWIALASRRRDDIGYSYLLSVLESAATAEEFFGRLIDDLLSPLQGTNYRLGTPATTEHQPRVFEFLGMAAAREWLLFPFVHHSSRLPEHYILMHGCNVARFFNERYRSPAISTLIEHVKSIPATKSTHIGSLVHLRTLVMCSTFRKLEHCNSDLFSFCIAHMAGIDTAARTAASSAQAGMARRTFNILLNIYNGELGTAAPLRLVALPKNRTTLSEYASLTDVRQQHRHLCEWIDAFEAHIRSSTDSQGEHRRKAAREFLQFLAQFGSAPCRPEDVQRKHINDYQTNTETYRNYLARLNVSNNTRNRRLQMLSEFFNYVREQLALRSEERMQPPNWFMNPVDMKLDRFAESHRAGTHRKAIGSHIIETMRDILVDDDYAWPKQAIAYDWTHVVDRQTGQVKYEWCPSATILLYLLLSVPLRSLQARLLDSGEGDAEIFDFDTRRMIANPAQLQVDGKYDGRRRDGVLQVMPSGMLGVTDIVGLWISTNKTSDKGYAIPWVSDELLQHLKYQRDWISRYTSNPQMHGIIAAQGYSASKPAEWQENERKFYCLFRDPGAERSVDLSMPVSRQKLLKLWGHLCCETERRINAKATNDSERIQLGVRKGPTDYPRSLFDLHTLRVSGITDLLDRGVPLNIVSQYVAGHATYIMTLWYDKPAPGRIREALRQAHERRNGEPGSIPSFTQEELKREKAYLLSHPDYQGRYTGFDALEENAGLVLFRQAGICPGARCEEGSLDEHGRACPVPAGDRGPSCPQCRFWLTGPAFLLGQVIEGNQLILKIRKKVHGLTTLREKVIKLEDCGDVRGADVARGQTDVEERQLNDMLTEWWHRIRFYSASIEKLEDYRAYREDSRAYAVDKKKVVLFAQGSENELRYNFDKSTDIALKHFLSTCAEIMPEFEDRETGATQDIELAVGRFLAINDEKELTRVFFTLNDAERLTTANLVMELMTHAADPQGTEELISGARQLASVPELHQGITRLLQSSATKAFTFKVHELLPSGAKK